MILFLCIYMNTRGIRYDIIHIMSQTDPLFSMDIPGFLFFLRFSNIIFKKTYGPESRFADPILF